MPPEEDDEAEMERLARVLEDPTVSAPDQRAAESALFERLVVMAKKVAARKGLHPLLTPNQQANQANKRTSPARAEPAILQDFLNDAPSHACWPY